MMTPQQNLQAKLIKCGLPHKEVRVYGSQIMITAWSRDAADKWQRLLCRFARVKSVVESVDYNQVNRNTVMNPTVHTVWRVWATI